ncbi:hypothetical protein MHTCC0001_19650 [Flavobacteriaceae bacterium MHTCC 0001]
MKLLLYISLYICLLAVNFSFAQIANISFLNRDYPYGLKPTNIQAGDLSSVYTSWRNSFAATCSNGRYRIKFDTPSETVSEGVAYGMLLSAYANDKELFDGLWLYYNDFLNSNGVMNWKINGCSSVLGQNGATDAELDAAIALMVADKKWGNTGAIHYKNDAVALIGKIKAHEVEAGTNVLKPGDVWGGSDTTNPSYFATGYFRAFGTYTNDTTFWNAVADKCYAIISANLSKQSAVYNLVSDWTEADGDYSTNASGYDYQGKFYYYDAARTPWRIAVDYLWYGDTKALNYLNLCNNFVDNAGGFDKIYPGYSQSGVAINTSYKDPTFTGAYATAGMVSSNQNYINSGYTELKAQSTSAYFGATLRAIYMFVLSGNGYNPVFENVLHNPTVNKSNSINIYPNPIVDSIYLKFNISKSRIINLYSLKGDKLLSKTTNLQEVSIDATQLHSGVYFLGVGNGKYYKLIKH